MPFGLSNAPASFQGYINKILGEKLDIFVIVYLDDIFIYTKDPGQDHIDAVRWVLKELRKNRLFTNLKKCYFHKDKVRFLGYIVSAQGVRMEKERIDAVKNWPEPKSVRDMQVFLGFANFYCRFIQGFNRIAALLTSMLKMSPTPTSVTSKSMNLVDEFGEGDCGKNEARMSASTKWSTRADYPSSNHVNHAVNNYLTPDAKKAFDQWSPAFTKAPIFQHFDLERYIRVKTDASGYAIGGVLSQLTNNLGRWHPVAYFSYQMIPAKTWYKTHDGELLAIVKAFKTWRHYLENCKHKVFVLTDYNNLRQLIDTKSLSFCQVSTPYLRVSRLCIRS